MSFRLITSCVSFSVAASITLSATNDYPSENDALSGLVEIVRTVPSDEFMSSGGIIDDVSVISVLDDVIDIYESNDFYESGYWGKDNKTFTSDVYVGLLPEYSYDDFVRPVMGGEFTSMFGYRKSYGRMHKGVDISLKEGDVVKAALPGVVGRIGYEPGGYGHFVIVVHSDGVETRYAHLSRVTAVLGQKVAAGEGIALGGNTGNSTGPHLHFEVRKRGKAVDPLLIFSF